MAAGILDSSHPSEVECVFRHLEFAHRRSTQLIFCQELRLVILHERKEPVSALLPLLCKVLREFLFPGLRHCSNSLQHTAAQAASAVGEYGLVEPFLVLRTR